MTSCRGAPARQQVAEHDADAAHHREEDDFHGDERRADRVEDPGERAQQERQRLLVVLQRVPLWLLHGLGAADQGAPIALQATSLELHLSLIHI